MKILLTGKDGQVGFELQRSLAPLGEVVALDRMQCDLSDVAALRALVRTVKPRVIVNPAAYTAVDKAESDREQAFAVNAVAPGILAEEARNLDALLVHYSTDYVFDGNRQGAYTESDLPNPQCVYGLSKYGGERALRAHGERYLIFRTSWVVGAHGENFMKTILRLAAARESLNIVADQLGVPTSAALLADVTAQLVREACREKNDFPHGLYHLVAGGETNWYRYACYAIGKARAAGQPIKVAQKAINPIRTSDYPTPAKRPANSRLDTAHLRNTFGLHLPDWTHGVDHILEQIFQNS
uniref:dTDP-4-dehydrorhamnose reductase n=1 Tax=Candidatus Kentrum sp. FW TaxID=2126338 RepID=A0A450T4S2_9GAMM|nr:MAG: dTDP-4-dehydrorhamnose reductase [Candidatus Kentron sp. FW]